MPADRRRRIGGIVALLAIATAPLLALDCSLSNPRYRGPESDHFDGKRFHNDPVVDHGLRGVVRWMRERQRGEWPERVEIQPAAPPASRVYDRDLRLTFVNHATFLLQAEGYNLLTDPVWSERTSPVSCAGPKRVKAPGLRFEDLPPIDVVLVSHNHYDHMDLPTLRRLRDAHDPLIVTPLGNARFLRRKGLDRVVELDWWENHVAADMLDVTCVPAVHFSGRGPTDRNRALWGGFVAVVGRNTIYFAGDTGYGDHFQQIVGKVGPLRLALLPIGAYEPQWFMGPVHMNPAEALRAYDEVGATYGVGMHLGTFELADDGYQQPGDDLVEALKDVDADKTFFWALESGTVLELVWGQGAVVR